MDPQGINPDPVLFSSNSDASAPLPFLEGTLIELFKGKDQAWGESKITIVWRGKEPPRIMIEDAVEIRFERQVDRKNRPA